MRLIDNFFFNTNLFNYYKYPNSKKENRICKTRAFVYLRFKKINNIFFKKIFFYNDKIKFFKKFLLNCSRFKNSTKIMLSVCWYSGKHRSSINNISLKRHSFKKILTLNNAPFIIKKLKKMILKYNFFSKIFIKSPTSRLSIFFSKFFIWYATIYGYKFFGKLINLYFYFFYVFFKKFSFVGKTYRFLKKKKKLRFIFNRAHRTIIYFNNFFKIRKKKKTKCKFWFFFFNDLGFFIGFLKKIRRVNIFTKRGIKINRLPFLKKKGKKSAYR